MDDALLQVKNAVQAGRTDILNTVLENSVKCKFPQPQPPILRYELTF